MHSIANEMCSEVHSNMNGLRSEMSARFDTTIRWVVGLIFASWMTLMAAIWLKIGS